MHSWGNPLFTPKKAVVCTGDLLPVNLSRHPLQLIFSVVGVALGVAAVFSIDLANDSARRAFRISAQTVAGKATHQIVGGPSGLEESLYTTLRRHGGVRTIAPIVDGYALAPGRPGLTLHILGMVTRSIGDLYFALSIREVSLTAATFLKAVGLGIFGAVAASLWPAHEATSTPTRDVMRRSAIETGVRKILPAVSAKSSSRCFPVAYRRSSPSSPSTRFQTTVRSTRAKGHIIQCQARQRHAGLAHVIRGFRRS